MEIILIILTGILMSAFSLLVYWVGYHEGQKSQSRGVKLTNENREALKGIAEWLNYGGRNDTE